MRRLILLTLCIAVSEFASAAPRSEAEIHLAEAVSLAGEAGLFHPAVHMRLDFMRFFPRSSTVFKESRPRKEILEAALKAANNAVFLDPDLHEAWYIRALCLKSGEIGKYGEALDILVELTGRDKISQDLRRITLWEIVYLPALKFPVDRLAREMDRALLELSSLPISDLERHNVSMYRVLNAVERWKDPSKAFPRIREAFGESERSWKVDPYKRIIPYANLVEKFIQIGKRPAVAEKDVLDAIQPYLTADLPEKRAGVWHHVGHFYEETSQWNKAIAAYRKSAEDYIEASDRGDVVDVYGLNLYGLKSAANLMRILLKTAQNEEAVRLGERFLAYPGKEAVEKRPDIYKTDGASEIRYYLAEAYEKTGDPQRALALYVEADRRRQPPSRIDTQRQMIRLRRSLKLSSRTSIQEVSADWKGLPSQPVTALASADGKIWAGVFPGVAAGVPVLLNREPSAHMAEAGLYSRRPGKAWTRVPIPDMADSTPVTCLATFDGKLWAGTFGGGLASYDPLTKSWEVIDERSGLPMNHILSLHPDGDRLWIGFGDLTRGGLGWLTPDDLGINIFPSERRKTAAPAGSPAGSVTAIVRWGDDIYAAEYLVGVKSFRRDHLTPEFHAVSEFPRPALPHRRDSRNRISALHVWDQKLWIGFYSAGSSPGLNYALGGISAIGNRTASKLYLSEEGLPDNSVTSFITFDGNLIAGTAGDNEQEGGLASYDESSDRWIGVDGFRVLSLCADGGTLYVGTSEGVRVFERR